MICIGDKNVKKSYWGGKAIKKAYLGDKLLLRAASKLPDGYTELQYIESSGTQYVRTSVLCSKTLRIDMSVDLTSVNSTFQYLFGVNENTGSANIGIRFGYSTSYGRFFYGSKSFNTISAMTPGRHKISLDGINLIAEFDDEILPLEDSNLTSNVMKYPMYLFGYLSIGKGISARSKIKMYSCQIFDNGALVGDFVPCTDPSGEVGLYDLVGKSFYSSNSTTPFSAGPSA